MQEQNRTYQGTVSSHKPHIFEQHYKTVYRSCCVKWLTSSSENSVLQHLSCVLYKFPFPKILFYETESSTYKVITYINFLKQALFFPSCTEAQNQPRRIFMISLFSGRISAEITAGWREVLCLLQTLVVTYKKKIHTYNICSSYKF
jgi:hypothetical protein